MTTDEFFRYIDTFFAMGSNLIRRKNTDYAGTDNPFRNFYVSEHIGITDAKTALLVRMADKMSRIANLLKQEAAVSDESIHDTLQDLSNYSAILSALIADERKT